MAIQKERLLSGTWFTTVNTSMKEISSDLKQFLFFTDYYLIIYYILFDDIEDDKNNNDDNRWFIT